MLSEVEASQISPPPRGERGVILIMVLAFIVILVVLVTSFYIYIRGEEIAARNLMGLAQARHVAAGGLEHAIRAL